MNLGLVVELIVGLVVLLVVLVRTRRLAEAVLSQDHALDAVQLEAHRTMEKVDELRKPPVRDIFQHDPDQDKLQRLADRVRLLELAQDQVIQVGKNVAAHVAMATNANTAINERLDETAKFITAMNTTVQAYSETLAWLRHEVTDLGQKWQAEQELFDPMEIDEIKDGIAVVNAVAQSTNDRLTRHIKAGRRLARGKEPTKK